LATLVGVIERASRSLSERPEIAAFMVDDVPEAFLRINGSGFRGHYIEIFGTCPGLACLSGTISASSFRRHEDGSDLVYIDG